VDTIKSEGQKAAAVVGAVATEATHIAGEVGDKLADAASGLADHAKEASTRLRGAAQEESEAQKGETVEGTADYPALTPADDLIDDSREEEVGEIDRRSDAEKTFDPARG
jgi:hypothetical protein